MLFCAQEVKDKMVQLEKLNMEHEKHGREQVCHSVLPRFSKRQGINFQKGHFQRGVR